MFVAVENVQESLGFCHYSLRDYGTSAAHCRRDQDFNRMPNSWALYRHDTLTTITKAKGQGCTQSHKSPSDRQEFFFFEIKDRQDSYIANREQIFASEHRIHGAMEASSHRMKPCGRNNQAVHCRCLPDGRLHRPS